VGCIARCDAPAAVPADKAATSRATFGLAPAAVPGWTTSSCAASTCPAQAQGFPQALGLTCWRLLRQCCTACVAWVPMLFGACSDHIVLFV
jgi:hypothetical protein